MSRVKECSLCGQGFTEDNSPVGTPAYPIHCPAGVHAGAIWRIDVNVPKFVIDLDRTILIRHMNPMALMAKIRMKASSRKTAFKLPKLTDRFSSGSFEGRVLLFEAHGMTQRVFFRRGLTELLLCLGKRGVIILASHAGRLFVATVAAFLRRNVKTRFPIEGVSFSPSVPKMIIGNVQLVLDDQPARWVAGTAVTAIRGFDGRNPDRDGALYLLMLQRPELFPHYNPLQLRTLVAQIQSDDVILLILEYLLPPVLPLAVCRCWFCGAFKYKLPNSACESCTTRDANRAVYAR